MQIKSVNSRTVFLHRGEEVTADILDSNKSIVFDATDRVFILSVLNTLYYKGWCDCFAEETRKNTNDLRAFDSHATEKRAHSHE